MPFDPRQEIFIPVFQDWYDVSQIWITLSAFLARRVVIYGQDRSGEDAFYTLYGLLV